MANTSLGVVLAAMGLIFVIRGRKRSEDIAGRILAIVAGLLGVLTLFEYGLAIDLGIDQLVARDPSGGDAPGRMAPTGALFLALAGLGIAFLKRGRRWLSAAPAIGALLIGYIGLAGYALGIEGLYGIGDTAALAAPSAMAAILLGTSALIAVPDQDPVVRLTWHDAGGTMARIVLPVLTLLVVGLSWLMMRITHTSDGFLPPEAMLLQIVFLTSLLIAGTWYLAGVLHRVDSERQERTNQVLEDKDRFLASVSHELRTPITAVVGFAELLTGMGSDLPEEERMSILDTLARQGSELVAILEDLLVVARHDARTLSVANVRVNLRAQAAQAIETLVDKTPTVRSEPPDVTVQADPLRVRQILRNLLTNAYRYGNGEVTVELASDDHSGYVRVMDNGPGIRTEDRAKIFEPYVTLHGDSGRPGSVGLGLPVARALAIRMGGELDYRRVDDWTCFELILPLAESTIDLASTSGVTDVMARSSQSSP
jgi:signal transduction histidine kinase